MTGPLVGVLALQGAFAEHRAALEAVGARTVEIRTPGEWAGAQPDAVVIPGGESTTMYRLLGTSGLWDPVRASVSDGLPAFGTCAGMILLATTVLDGRADQESMGAIDVVVRRNAYGRQVDSFETELELEGMDAGPGRFPAVFIRAPGIESTGPGVEILARHDDRPVLAREGAVLVSSFHPELTGDTRVHRAFVDTIG